MGNDNGRGRDLAVLTNARGSAEPLAKSAPSCQMVSSHVFAHPRRGPPSLQQHPSLKFKISVGTGTKEKTSSSYFAPLFPPNGTHHKDTRQDTLDLSYLLLSWSRPECSVWSPDRSKILLRMNGDGNTHQVPRTKYQRTEIFNFKV
ncbi:uncharacterized protein FOMMEDRAFT_170534 [Fomitiporia mediterranea MF3/22]|uniref:uncharacterized protein n=1 Tax=Fomitiporia mediterranea (strain MF3/22) TaxID=694068 RepID=UPI00044086D9|nr:uncharacterized protein FOMMEDRAFT_170534 [Fomitiporia mediterranea MF3/22]EJC99194.1 hypothetical protein FOMMEDRAFT_170534 [Fomitiporia mediterranea MF3/22]